MTHAHSNDKSQTGQQEDLKAAIERVLAMEEEWSVPPSIGSDDERLLWEQLIAGKQLTWDDVTKLEPKLQALCEVLEDGTEPDSYDAWEEFWEDFLKPRISRFVGDGRRDSPCYDSRRYRDRILESSEAWDVTIQRLYDEALPRDESSGG